jgi:hypothetical protein
MKSTKIKVIEVTVDEMLADTENSAYNPAIWTERVKAMTKYGSVKFYKAGPDYGFKYDRFFVSYIIPEGLHLFRDFTPFCAGLTNRGFSKCFVIDGEIFIQLFNFSDKTEGVIKNCKEVRKFLKDNVCSKGIMVTTNF